MQKSDDLTEQEALEQIVNDVALGTMLEKERGIEQSVPPVNEEFLNRVKEIGAEKEYQEYMENVLCCFSSTADLSTIVMKDIESGKCSIKFDKAKEAVEKYHNDLYSLNKEDGLGIENQEKAVSISKGIIDDVMPLYVEYYVSISSIEYYD